MQHCVYAADGAKDGGGLIVGIFQGSPLGEDAAVCGFDGLCSGPTHLEYARVVNPYVKPQHVLLSDWESSVVCVWRIPVLRAPASPSAHAAPSVAHGCP